ncbi:MAG: polysulfide reductase NrfD [Coriobacteriia bacterium]|nr:polysulfide reductase NrfD [Coriobacteriia bacterium]
MESLQFVWSWQPALYLFLGGMGAGAFVAAGVLTLLDKDSNKKTIAGAMWGATFALIIGLLLLVTELIYPLRGLMLWQSFSNFTSWMTIGAWLLFAAVIIFLITALLKTEKIVNLIAKDKDGLKKTFGSISLILAVVGILLGVGVAVYTGILLMSAPGIPLWNTWLLPLLFTVSAFDTGVAFVILVSVFNAKKEKLTLKSHKFLETSTVILVILEIIVLVVFILLAGKSLDGAAADTAAKSIALLTTGSLAILFWGLLVAIGLVVPLAFAILGLLKLKKESAEDEGKKGIGLGLIGAIGALIGGCTLRFLMLLAGLHADYVGDAIAKLFS